MKLPATLSKSPNGQFDFTHDVIDGAFDGGGYPPSGISDDEYRQWRTVLKEVRSKLTLDGNGNLAKIDAGESPHAFKFTIRIDEYGQAVHSTNARFVGKSAILVE